MKPSSKISNPFDMRDGFFFGGLAIATAGGLLVSVPWTLVILGAVLALKGNGPLFRSRGGAD